MWKDATDPLRTCRECGRAEHTRFERCPHCDADYFGPTRAQRRRRRRIIVAAGTVLALTAGTLATASIIQSRDRDERRERDYRLAVVRKRAELVRVQAPHRGAAPELDPGPGATKGQRMAARKALLERVQAVITRDAQARERTGELDGPITHTECGPIERRRDAIPAHLQPDLTIGRYDCVAVKSDVRQHGKSVGRLGHPFVATLNFDRFTYVWCRNTPAQSEAGKALIFVRLERACLAAKGRALGTGYVDVPGT